MSRPLEGAITSSSKSHEVINKHFHEVYILENHFLVDKNKDKM